MAINEREAGAQQAEEPQVGSDGMPPSLTHDPTQGAGTPAWQLAQRHSMELNAKLRRN